MPGFLALPIYKVVFVSCQLDGIFVDYMYNLSFVV